MTASTAPHAGFAARRTARALAVGALLVAAASAAAGAQRDSEAIGPARTNFTETALPNGLRIVVHEDHSTPIASAQVWDHAGPANVPSGEHAAAVGACGGQSNARTTEDVTGHWNTVPAQRLPAVLWMEAGRRVSLRIEPSAFVRERAVQCPCVGVIRRGGDLVPERGLNEVQMNTSFAPSHFAKGE